MFKTVDTMKEDELEYKLKKLEKEYFNKRKITYRGMLIKKELFGKILDVGCDSHFLHNEIKNDETIGLDIKIEHARGNVIKGDAQCAPIKSKSFDCVVAGELIEHLKQPEKFLRECYRILKNHGKLIITTPNKTSWWNRITKSYFIKYHPSLLQKKELLLLLKKNGFHSSKFIFIPYDKFSNPFGQLYTLRKIIHYILPKHLGENMFVISQKNK
jgi:ubiquinone/menaquinone biosynthesis C-methylase UbiE